MNKCLARINKSPAWGKATKKREIANASASIAPSAALRARGERIEEAEQIATGELP
jgi:hypothetical protein